VPGTMQQTASMGLQRNSVSHLVQAAQEYKIPVPDGYEQLFVDLEEPSPEERRTRLLLGLADNASDSILPALIRSVEKLVGETILDNADESRISTIQQDFSKFVVPPKNPHSLMEIVIAGWRAFLDPDLWSEHPEIESRNTTLKELILKSIEVLEFRQILKS